MKAIPKEKQYVIPARLYDRLMELAKPQIERWHSVKDKMPEKGERVLCIFWDEEFQTRIVCENTYKGDGEWYDDGSKVTHWMPLPELPEVKDE